MFDPDADPARAKRERWWRGVFIVLATIYVALLLASLLVDILGGFTRILLILFVAWLLAFVLSPVVGLLSERFGIGRGVTIGLVYAATMVGSAFLLFYAATALGADLGKMAADFPLTRARIEGVLGEWSELLAFGNFRPDLVELYRDVEAAVVASAGSVLGEVPEVTLGVLGSLVLVVILSLYMLADSANIIARFERVVPARYADEAEILERTISTAFGGFLRAQVILAGIQTGLTILAVVLLDLPYGFLIVATSALAMLIPFFGPPLALIPPVVATAIFNPGWVIPVALVLLVVQTLLVNYVQPRLMREALGMHPILVLVGLLVGSQIAGLWGALFGIPILAVLNVFFTYAVNLRAIEETPSVEMEEVIEEVRQEAPDAPPEEVVAMAAERAEEAAEEAEAAAAGEAVTDDLRRAAGDLREAAGEQRSAAGEIGASASELREAVDDLREDRRRES
jgi:predicted PurR-regulated permease PerM